MNLQEYNREGLIPGPCESEEEFLLRARFCLNLKHALPEKVQAELPFDLQDCPAQNILEESFPTTLSLFGIAPTWVPLFFNNHQLSLWHAGCAWIFQLDDTTPTTSFLQLRSIFRTSSSYLFGLYHRKDLIAHELAHVARMMYQEPRFEELLAYQTSTSRFQKWLGPIFQSSKETLFFLLFVAMTLMIQLAFLAINHPAANQMALWVISLPLVGGLFAYLRLVKKHRILCECQKKLSHIYHNETLARHLTFRLLDHEIEHIASSSHEEILALLREWTNQSYRWIFLNLCYPN